MIAQDFEWAAGAKLLDYQILDEARSKTPTSASRSRSRWARQGKGKAVEKKASYVVGTSPSVTVFRDVMRR